MNESITKYCPNCERKFETENKLKKYCHERCRNAAEQKRNRSRNAQRVREYNSSPARKEAKRGYYERYKLNKPPRICKDCGVTVGHHCKYCANCGAKRKKENLYKKIRIRHLKSNYGLSIDEYERMCQDQKGVCAVCGSPPKRRRLAVDHNHKTGEVRSLLCDKCNLALGYANEDVSILQKMINYLTK